MFAVKFGTSPMSMKFIVIKKVNIRREPDTKTGYPLRIAKPGDTFEIESTITTPNKSIWGIMTSKDNQNEYMCIEEGPIIYAVKVRPDEAIFPTIEWVNSIDNWARIQGFKGVKP